ncbi:MAG TPA: cytochrome c biogenesis protein CcdA, partial [Chitinophagaceae bacterium]|nr:cytochrome c biogenesis protein CcdA [Chitinophagaceae bacterium]
MRSIIFILLCFLSPSAFCQQQPIQWDVSSQKTSDSSYVILVNAAIEPDWYVYASDDRSNDLEAVKISWHNEFVKAKGDLQASGVADIIQDGIFGNTQKVFKGGVLFRQEVITGNTLPAVLTIQVKAYAANGNTFLPINEELELRFEGGTDEKKKLKLTSVNLHQPLADCGDKQVNEKSLLGIFLLGFGGGLIALLTPCVFPMIPVTVSFFTKRSQNKKKGIHNGIIYGSFIFLIYLLASIPFHLVGNISPQFFNTLSTNAGVNIFFFVIFILFALSFFGVFELRLPSFIATKTDSKAGLNTIGIFFMALTLAIVSFSCTGPILGSLLVGSLSSAGGAWQLSSGMAGFGLALGLPFALFAIFPHWLQQLPKSGGWLEVVKKSLAFVELALAIKFLSNADLVEHWGILKREVFIGLWVIIFFGLSLYLLNVRWLARYGKFHASKGRLFVGSVALLFALYLIPGL